MTAPLDPLLSVDDDDWAAFKDKDPEWFLSAAGEAIRDYCGWHLSPSLTVTEPHLPIGTGGLIMLPSRFVTAVDSVVLFPEQPEPWVLEPTDYTWFPAGWIEQNTYPLWGWNYHGVYAYPPVHQSGFAAVTFTHGYDDLPDDIKAVGYELALSATQMPAGNIKEIKTPGFTLQPGQAFGTTLSTDQQNRLANYRIGMTA